MASNTKVRDGDLLSSATLTEHLLRGAAGASAFYAAITIAQTTQIWWTLPASLALGVVALVLFRGCPVCWTIGLGRTLYAKFAPDR